MKDGISPKIAPPPVTPITGLKGVGAKNVVLLNKLGITSVEDLVTFYPRKYEDFSNITAINKLRPGKVTIDAHIVTVRGRYARKGLHITEAVASDPTGSVRIIWFNQPYRAASIVSRQDYYISGEFGLTKGRMGFVNPTIERKSDFPLHSGRIIPVYKSTSGLQTPALRRMIRAALLDPAATAETLPQSTIKNERLLDRATALNKLHFPDSLDDVSSAKFRLGFEEIFELSLASLLNRIELAGNHSLNIPFRQELAREFVSHLPFTLTPAQKKVIWQIYLDMESGQPMNRLVEGDVGSGKTVVAAMAAVMVMSQSFQVAFMAPTELLATQHAEELVRLLRPLGFAEQVGLLTGSMTPKQKMEARARIKDGSITCIVGTHALVQESVQMPRLGLVIVDEQHRFGVAQRKMLQKKAGHMPHVIHMTATPIPRTLALTLYGEMDVSIIDTKPPGRLVVKTKVFPSDGRIQVNRMVKEQLSKGRQCFWVCPSISEDTEIYPNTSVESVFKRISQTEFKDSRVGLMHGKLKSNEKERIMKDFINHKLDILVSTTVIEVGVHVANAGVMVIEAAERFGLAQIHQLRGRVGRSSDQGYCYLITSDNTPPSRRLRSVAQSSDGFKLAEFDLIERGPGALYGTQQHGALDLRLADLLDVHLIARAKRAAQDFIDVTQDFSQYPRMYQRVNALRTITNLN